MRTPQEIKQKVDWLRSIAGGVPVGAKIGCGDIEMDVKTLVHCGVDFIAIDGFGGATGATNAYVRENLGIPVLAALPRARRALEEEGTEKEVTLIAGGGLRTSADFAKCLALGADAVYIATAALIAINCEQYRICHTGLCPTGVTSHDPALEKVLDVEEGVRRLSNFIKVSTFEMANLTRTMGKDSLSELGPGDLISMDRELSEITGVKWLGSRS
jgi:glutamate synthase domain-containing protein 2